MQRIQDQIDICEEQAVLARLRALAAVDQKTQREYQRLEEHWRALVRTLKFTASLSLQLQWASNRLRPPPQ